MHIEVYTDGSATTKDQPGGWGYVIVVDGQKYSEGSGHIEKGTNNDAELEAAIQGLEKIRQCFVDKVPDYSSSTEPLALIVTLVSDSQIVLGWASGAYAFRQENKIEKYKQLQILVKTWNVQTRWVEGHTGDEHNERCDKLANAARLQKDVNSIKEKQKRKEKSGITFRVVVDQNAIDKITNEAMSHANQLAHIGSDLWKTSVIDKFKELLDNNKWYRGELE